jgi:hypothetical protein
MKEKIMDILQKHYHGRNFIESNCADEIVVIIEDEKYKSFQDGVSAESKVAQQEIRNNYTPNR